jgi:purine-binding chemotaxis protein CheW
MEFRMTQELTQTEKDIQRILEERARDLGRVPKQKVQDAGGSHELLILGIGDELFGVNIESVQEIQMLKILTPVPGTPKFWAGLINLRGRLVPSLDLRAYLELTDKALPPYTKIVVINEAGIALAMLVHEVKGARRFAKESLRPPVKDTAREGVGIISGITVDLISVLDLNALLADPRLSVGEELTSEMDRG